MKTKALFCVTCDRVTTHKRDKEGSAPFYVCPDCKEGHRGEFDRFYAEDMEALCSELAETSYKEKQQRRLKHECKTS